MPNPLAFILNLSSDKDPENPNGDWDKNNKKKGGELFETYQKDMVAGTRRITSEDEKDKIWENVFVYQGGTNNPPDNMTRQVSNENKQTKRKNCNIMLNSSVPASVITPSSLKISKECKNLMIKSNIDCVPHFYNFAKISENRIKSIFSVDGFLMPKINCEVQEGMKITMKCLWDWANYEEAEFKRTCSKMGYESLNLWCARHSDASSELKEILAHKLRHEDAKLCSDTKEFLRIKFKNGCLTRLRCMNSTAAAENIFYALGIEFSPSNFNMAMIMTNENYNNFSITHGEEIERTCDLGMLKIKDVEVDIYGTDNSCKSKLITLTREVK